MINSVKTGGNILKKNKTQRRKTTKKRIGLFAFLFTISEGIARSLKRGPIGFFFADLYTKCNDKWKNGYIFNLFKRKKRRLRERATFAHIYEKSLTSREISSLSNTIVHSHLRIWGVGILFFAFSVIITAVIRYHYFGEDIFERFVYGVVMVLLAFPLIISKKELGEMLLTRRLTRFVITKVLNLNPTRFERSTEPFDGSYFIAIFFSIAVGFLTFFSHPLFVISIAILLVVFVLVMSFPELGLIFLMLMLPFANLFDNPTITILVLLGFSTLGFAVKLMRGKRVIRIELMDVMIIAFSVILLFGGVFTYGGKILFYSAAVYFGFLLIYFLITNMYIGKSSIYRAFKILIVCATFVSIVGVLNKGIINEAVVDMSMFENMPPRVSVFLNNANMLGAYLVIIFPLTLGQMIVSKRTISKVMYFIAAGFIFACIVLTGSRGAWVGVVVSSVVFLLVYNFKNIWLLLLVGGSVPFWYNLIPSVIINRISTIFTFADSSAQMRLDIWKGAWNMAKDNLFTGIGIGERAFKTVYGNYALPGAESAVHSHSLLLQILVDIGIVGVIIFVIIMFMYSQKCFVEVKQCERKSKSRTMIIAGLSSIFGVLVVGLADNIWYNYRVFILFWIVLALTSSLARNNVRERESTRVINNMTSADLEISR